MKNYIAELFGTAVLTLAVSLSLHSSFPVPTPLIAALTLGLFVYLLGPISGAHFNPAITVGLLSLRKITLGRAVGYVFAQLAGATLALGVARWLGLASALTAGTTLTIGWAELLGAFIFAFGVAAVASAAVPAEFSGVVVGSSLLLGLSLAAGIGSNAVLNPAVALGIGSLSLMYAFAPAVGAVLGMQLFRWLTKKKA